MSYRDDYDAARARADALAQEVEALEAGRSASAQELARVRAELGAARREVEALSAYAPGSARLRRAPYRAVLHAALGLAVATAVAGYHSEPVGVAMSYFAAGAAGIGAGGWVGARFSARAGVTGALAGAMSALLSAFIFYSVVWPAL